MNRRMSPVVAIAAAGLLLACTSCSSSSGTDSGGAAPSGGATQTSARISDGKSSDLAALETADGVNALVYRTWPKKYAVTTEAHQGRLVLLGTDGNCLGYDEAGQRVVAVLPPGATLSKVGGKLAVSQPGGMIVPVGQEVIAGYFRGPSASLEDLVGDRSAERLPQDCRTTSGVVFYELLKLPH